MTDSHPKDAPQTIEQAREPRCKCGHYRINHVHGLDHCQIGVCDCVIYETAPASAPETEIARQAVEDKCGACCECKGRHCNVDHPGHSCSGRVGLAEHTRSLLLTTARSHRHGYEHAKKQIRFLLFRQREWIHPERLSGILKTIDDLQSTDGLSPTNTEAEARLAPAPGWQPIETAPKDSRRILVAYQSELVGWLVKEAWWRIPYEEAKPDEGYWQTMDGALLSSGVHTAYKDGRPLGATHWQPLPPPPGAPA